MWTGTWNPTPLFTVEFSGERDRGRLAADRFAQTLVGTRLRVNLSPDLSIASYVQYDTDSDSYGTNTRLHNLRSILDRWQLESNQLLVTVQYAWRL